MTYEKAAARHARMAREGREQRAQDDRAQVGAGGCSTAIPREWQKKSGRRSRRRSVQIQPRSAPVSRAGALSCW
jgi:hypothetical protein